MSTLGDDHAAIQYEPDVDVLTIQFGTDRPMVDAGNVMDDVFVAFDAAVLGSPAVVRLATPFWGRGRAWLSAVEELVTPSVLAAARSLAEEQRRSSSVVNVDDRESLKCADRRVAYHRALCLRAEVALPDPKSPRECGSIRSHSIDNERSRGGE